MAEPVYFIEERNYSSIPIFRAYQEFRLALNGNGYLSGSFPSGITTVDGVPVSAKVRVLLRAGEGKYGDGAVVKTVVSAINGTWLVTGLDMRFKYDVVARYAGENDVIMSSVTPVLM